MLRVTGHPGIRIAAPPFYSTAVAVKWVLSFDGSHGSGETRTRTGDTMIFSRGISASYYGYLQATSCPIKPC